MFSTFKFFFFRSVCSQRKIIGCAHLVISLLLVFIKNKNRNQSLTKVENLGDNRLLIYKLPRRDLGP